MSIIDKNRSYNLPASMALVLGAERGELVSVAIRQVEEGELVPNAELTIELLALVGNLVNDLREAKWKLMRVEEEVADLLDGVASMRGNFKKVQRACNVIDEIMHDEEAIEEDE